MSLSFVATDTPAPWKPHSVWLSEHLPETLDCCKSFCCPHSSNIRYRSGMHQILHPQTWHCKRRSACGDADTDAVALSFNKLHGFRWKIFFPKIQRRAVYIKKDDCRSVHVISSFCFIWFLLLLFDIRSKSSFNDLVSSKISTVHPLYQSCSRKDQQRKHNCHGYQNFTDCRSPLPLLFYKSLIYV